MARITLALVTALTLVSALPTRAQTPTFVVELEGGPVWQTTNDVEIPNDGSATRFSLSDLAGTGPWPAARLYVTWNVAERHGIRILLAPLSVSGTGVPDEAVRFAGETYAPGSPVEGTYTFNSYRLGYRYRFHEGERWTWWTGLTAKIRDATIELEQGATASRKDDVGFVPLLHLGAEWRVSDQFGLVFDTEALGGGPGRAIDAALEIAYDVDEAWQLQLGYRTVEGGADVDEVYNFAWLHYAVASVVWRPGA